MSDDLMLKCLIVFILGYFISRHMGDGFSVGGIVLADESELYKDCMSDNDCKDPYICNWIGSTGPEHCMRCEGEHCSITAEKSCYLNETCPDNRRPTGDLECFSAITHAAQGTDELKRRGFNITEKIEDLSNKFQYDVNLDNWENLKKSTMHLFPNCNEDHWNNVFKYQYGGG